MPADARLFARYPNPVLVETGTWHGDGVAAALEAGFPCVYSIELSEMLYARACDRFHGDPRVTLYVGQSNVWLPEVLDLIDGPATFWLDAHYSAGDTARGDVFCPILDELALIARHPVKTHTLLIDDLRLFGPGEFGVSYEQLHSALMDINPTYVLTYADSPMAAADILVVRP